MKECSRCHNIKSLDEFHKSSRSKDGHKELCKSCKKEDHHTHYILNKDSYIENNKLWTKRNRCKMRSYYRKYNKTQNRKKYITSYRIKNRLRRTIYQRRLMHTNISYRIATYLRHRLGSAIKSQNCQKINKTLILLGCSVKYFRAYLESKFSDGMTWDNYGKWHIDHIKPCATFDLSIPSEQCACFHYTNMQPLWSMDNYRKGISRSSQPVG